MIGALIFVLALCHVVTCTADPQDPATVLLGSKSADGRYGIDPFECSICDFSEYPECRTTSVDVIDFSAAKLVLDLFDIKRVPIVGHVASRRNWTDAMAVPQVTHPLFLEFSFGDLPRNARSYLRCGRMTEVLDLQIVSDHVSADVNGARFDGNVCPCLGIPNAPGVLHHILSRNESAPNQIHGPNSEERHNPLSDGVRTTYPRATPVDIGFLIAFLACGTGVAIAILRGLGWIHDRMEGKPRYKK